MSALEGLWQEHLGPEFDADYMASLRAFLTERKAAGATIYPAGSLVFNAYQRTPLERVRVVIIGQDPYHGPRQAHGLSFSVPVGVRIPPSLANIFVEIERDLGIAPPSHGNLESWAEQGVLLLNSVLTVERGEAGSHRGKGWECFTDRTIEVINQAREGVVFLLWGADAKRKGKLVDRARHRVLESVHPSPLSAHRGFIGCGHFSTANQALVNTGQPPIHWGLPAA